MGEKDNLEKDSDLARAMTSYELVKYHFEDMGFTNENPRDLEMIAELHERWLRKDKTGLTKEQYILLQDPDVQEVLKRCREKDQPDRRMSKTDLKILLERIANGQVERKDYVGKDAECVWLTPNFTERLNAIKILLGDADTEGSEKVYFIDDIEAKYLEMQKGVESYGTQASE